MKKFIAGPLTRTLSPLTRGEGKYWDCHVAPLLAMTAK